MFHNNEMNYITCFELNAKMSSISDFSNDWCFTQKTLFTLHFSRLENDSNWVHWKKKWCQFDLKSWVTGGTKIRTWIPSNWRIFESSWLDIESQNESNWLDILQLLGIQGRILVPPVTQIFRSKWLHFSFSDVKLFNNP